MNLDKLFSWVIGIVVLSASVGKLNILQAWIWKAQAQVIYESRTSSWGSPRFAWVTSKTPTAPAQKIFKADFNTLFSKSNLECRKFVK